MGAGGRINVSFMDKKVLERVPVEKPPFGLSDLKKAIPPHCFNRSLVPSFTSVFRDLTLIYTFYYLAVNYIHLLPQTLSYIAWPLYWVSQGSILAALWIIAHDCSHHAFSEYQWVDDAVGFLLHSFCLTPYFSLKYSHRRHHTHTNSMEYDEVYVPKRKSDKLYSEYLNNPLGFVFRLTSLTVVGFPMYLSFNLLGRKYERFANHFFPQSPIFNDRERPYVLLSDAGVIAVIYLLYHIMETHGAMWTFCVCGGPLLSLGSFVIFITYLNHTHASVPHYDSTEWDWLRGSLSTIDRDFGFLNWVFHHETDTHVMHHLFPTMPHYHAVEATEAIKPILGRYRKYDNTPILKAFWRELRDCVYAEADEGAEKYGVYWYYN